MDKINFYVLLTIVAFYLIGCCTPDKKYQKIEERGSFIIAAICKNGIVVGSDSRSSFVDSTKSVYAYYEPVPKIFNTDSVVIATAGIYSFDTISVSKLIKDFVKNNPKIQLENFRSSFFKYAENKLSPFDYFTLINENQFLICGYQLGKPKIYRYSIMRFDSITTFGYMCNIDKLNNNQNLKNSLKNVNIDSAAVLIQKIIDIAPSIYKPEFIPTIGGASSIVYMNQSGIEWLSKQDKYDFGNMKEFARAYIEGKVFMQYRSPSQDSLVFRTQILQLLKH